MKRLRFPLDAGDALAAVGVVLIAWTVYLYCPVAVPAFLGIVCLIAWLLREVTSGTAGTRN